MKTLTLKNLFLLLVVLLAGNVFAQNSRVLRIGLVVPPTQQWSLSAAKFGEELKEATSGRLTVAIFPSSQLGSEAQMIQQIQTGALDMGFLTTAELANRVPELAALHAPFLVKDLAQARMVLESPIATKIFEKFPASIGAVGLGYGMNGMRHILTRDVSSGPADLKGKKIRVIPTPVMRDFYEIMGATPTPIPFAAIYEAFANGQVDGIDMDFEATYYNKYHTIAKTMLVTNQTMLPMAAIFSLKVWRELTDADHKLIQQLIDKQMRVIRDAAVTNEESFRKRLAETGFQMKPVPREAFGDAVQKWDSKWVPKAPDIPALRAFAAKQ
ncbi:MAG: TRAP transporter substrate-binding protein [Ramlibacter sp.]|nr:TRAP transporter substrate-binding protein [Ramlibacter sp.]